jgi:acetylornithine/N-succinyldiaminopimelate aminotransferase
MDTKTLMEWSAKYHTPNYGRTPLVLVRGEGTRVWDSDGREYLDFTTGIAVTGLGHCHPVITGTIREAAATLLHVSNIFHNAPQVHLAKLLVEHSFADRVFFCNSGAEANEAALKVVRKYAKERLSTDRYEVIATNNSFHGRTLATVSATGQPKYHHGFEPLMPGFKHVPYNDLRAMQRALDSRTAAILVEPIQGEGGVNIPDDGYLPGLRKLCDDSGALLIFDEVQTGMGRLGTWFAYQRFGVQPDLMTLAKGLAGGVACGALIASEAVAPALRPGMHASTFGGNPLAMAAGIATGRTIEEDGLLENCREMSDRFQANLAPLVDELPIVRELRVCGLMVGLELTIPAKEVVAKCLERGLLVNGTQEVVVRLLPALNVTAAQVDEGCEILAAVLRELAEQV